MNKKEKKINHSELAGNNLIIRKQNLNKTQAGHKTGVQVLTGKLQETPLFCN